MLPPKERPSSWRVASCGWWARRKASDRSTPWQYARPLVLLLVGACAGGPADRPAENSAAAEIAAPSAVLPGIDVLLRDPRMLAGKRVGLITNHTGITVDGRLTIDALHEHPDIQLIALFGPEHGLRGTAEAGELVDSGQDSRTGLPIRSLYGETRKPTAEMLRDVDVLVFDIQHVGTRYYTYDWTMALALEAAAEEGKEFVVLDRPNPIGARLVQGNVLDTAFATFVGLHPVPMRFGMTIGELARFVNAEFGVGANLTVVPVEGWSRDAYFDETGLTWVPPSPNMPSLESAIHYPGTCLFEGTNLSVGRGTSEAFRQIGAPWLDAEALASRLEARGIPGVRIETVSFTPQQPGDGKYDGDEVAGLRFTVTDRNAYDPTLAAVATLVELQSLHGDRLEFLESHFDRLAGTDQLRLGILAGHEAAALAADWPEQLARFREKRQMYLLY